MAARPLTWTLLREQLQDMQLRLLHAERHKKAGALRDALRQETIEIVILLRRMNGLH